MIELDVAAAAREDLPIILGRLVELEARVRLRLSEVPSPAPTTSKVLDAAEGAALAGTTRRWLLTATKGMKFRCDLSRKMPRFDENGLRGWLAGRRR